jgi:Flp pilus assembly protein TadG
MSKPIGSSGLRCERGMAAVEFALLLPAFAAFVVGIFYGCLMVYSIVGMHFAVEGAARCYSLGAGQCTSASATQTYAQSIYHGPNSPTFVASTAACGHQVSSTVTFTLDMVSKTWSVPLAASACFP